MKIISFEGIGGAGKTTLSKQLAENFSKSGSRVFYHRPISRKKLEKALSVFPGKKEQVWVCRLPYVSPRVEAFSYLSFLIDDCEKILNDKEKSDLVYLDRYIDTISAHIVARNNLYDRQLSFNDFYHWFKKIYEKEIIIPNKTLILDVGLDVAEKRTIKREDKKYTKADRRGFRIIKSFYDFLIQQEPERFVKIDANQSLGVVIKQAREVIQDV